ncbi:hypothetical protein NIES2119_18075 [[Phormidium ambiguum] IAM M-71]|uniref:Uncharacterized protein n=1 Tax=[Phormidium ambiguum] IAM M-71 TaxID=454136 RepID=A0A1U7IGQ4_9CYAN|nr:hypothetical protein [Phormidium ambiguum]OKH36211.1 hypothetical protein NIES2119_18075 [Phormidium ambiguum IAM M-71]
MDKQGKVDFVWRYQPSKNTADGLLMSYIKDSLFMLPKEMILYPLRAYWLALAYQEKGDIDPVLLERIFRKAVYALEKHALYLCDQARIDYPGNFYREASILRTFPLPQENASGENDVDANSDSSNSQNDGLVADELFELVVSEEFDDSGFS